MNNLTKKMEESNYIFCAIDLHQNSMLAGVAVNKSDIRYKSFDTDESSGVFKLVQTLDDLKAEHLGSQVWVAYEASGCGFRLADILEGEGFRVSVLAPTHLPVSQKVRSNKTDKRDVRRIMDVLRGHVLAGNELPEVWIPSPQLRDDREIVRRRVDIKDSMTRIKNGVHGLLRRYGHKKPEHIKTNWSKQHFRWLYSMVEQLEFGAGRHLSSLLRELEFYLEESDLLERELLDLSRTDRYQAQVDALTEIRGVAVLTAMTFITELGDMNRFGNRRRVGSFLGLAPKTFESGELDDRKGHISKMGPSRVRKVLNQAAWSVVKWDEDYKRWYEQKSQGKKVLKRKAITATMRKLGVQMWHIAQDAAA